MSKTNTKTTSALSAIIGLTAGYSLAPAPPPVYIPLLGDANFDGIVNFEDITAVQTNWLATAAASPFADVLSMHDLVWQRVDQPPIHRSIAIFNRPASEVIGSLPGARMGAAREIIRAGPGGPYPDEVNLIIDWMFKYATDDINPQQVLPRTKFLNDAITEGDLW